MSLFVLVRAPTPFTCGRQRWPLTTIIHRPRGQGCEDRHPQSRVRYPQRTHGRGQAPFRIGRTIRLRDATRPPIRQRTRQRLPPTRVSLAFSPLSRTPDPLADRRKFHRGAIAGGPASARGRTR